MCYHAFMSYRTGKELIPACLAAQTALVDQADLFGVYSHPHEVHVILGSDSSEQLQLLCLSAG